MIKTNICLRHSKEGEDLMDGEFDGHSIDIEDNVFNGIIEDFEKSNKITDEVAASAVELIIDIASKDEINTDERERTAQYIACAVLRQNFINKFGSDEVGNGIISIMDETAVDGDISVWLNLEGEDAKFYVTLGRGDDLESVH